VLIIDREQLKIKLKFVIVILDVMVMVPSWRWLGSVFGSRITRMW
jgi:hypothetical protein